MKRNPARHIHDPRGVKATITESAGDDGAMVVFIDTTFEPDGTDGPGLRVVLNDSDLYAGVAYRPAREEVS